MSVRNTISNESRLTYLLVHRSDRRHLKFEGKSERNTGDGAMVDRRAQTNRRDASFTPGGTPRWISPELLVPQRFGLDGSRPMKKSDCYALGMVIYEVGASVATPCYRYRSGHK